MNLFERLGGATGVRAIVFRTFSICILVGASFNAALAEDAPSPATKAQAPVVNAPAAPPSGTSAVVMDLSAIESVIGKSVKSSGGEDLGRIVDLLVTTSGQVRGAIIDFGGVLGVGSRKIAVDWKALDFSDFKDASVKIALTRNQMRMAPEYKSGDPVVILQPSKSDAIKPEQTKADQGQPDPTKSEALKPAAAPTSH